MSRLMPLLLAVATSLVASTLVHPEANAQPAMEIPLEATGGGAYELTLSVAGNPDFEAAFLLDTGAAMVTVSEGLYRQLKKVTETRQLRTVAGRMADGRYKQFPVYEIKGLTLGDSCDLQTLEVLVVGGKGRNLLGLNALERVAPFTMSLAPPALLISGCNAPVLTESVAAADR